MFSNMRRDLSAPVSCGVVKRVSVTLERPPWRGGDAARRNVVVSVDRPSPARGMQGTRSEAWKELLGSCRELWETPAKTSRASCLRGRPRPVLVLSSTWSMMQPYRCITLSVRPGVCDGPARVEASQGGPALHSQSCRSVLQI